MPLLRFDLIEGRSESELKKILDVTHEVLLDTLQVPKHDRYQVVHEHKRSRMVIEDTGLGFARSDKIVVLQITSRPRKREMKQAFYRLLVERLSASCGIAPTDVVVNFVTNADEDWSFGAGRAQFLTGEPGEVAADLELWWTQKSCAPSSIARESTVTTVAHCYGANITKHQGDYRDDNH
jgi:hypothetical protein